MSEIELKACPFCGSKPETGSWQKRGMTVQCSSSLTDCPVCPGYSHYEPEGAVAAWNTRAPQWLPIESAPEDGTEILVWDGRGITSVRWHFSGWSLVYCGWRAEDGDFDGATHWMPLPAPPEVEG